MISYFTAHDFCERSLDLYHIEAWLHQQDEKDAKLSDADIKEVLNHIEPMEAEACRINLDISLISDCKNYLKTDGADKRFSIIKTKIGSIREQIRSELSRQCFLYIKPENKEFLDKKESYIGEKFSDKFTDILEDAVEAGNCFATGRNTACVFHLMRVMERGTQKFGERLGVDFTEKKLWYNILKKSNEKIENLSKGSLKTQYAAIYSNLNNVRLAWRNETMHPKATYTEDEARNILNCVKAFMLELSGII